MKEERIPLVFENMGEKIFAVLHKPLKHQNPPIVVTLHGFASHKVGTNRAYVRLAERLTDVGIANLRFDMRGCGDSEGSLSTMSVEDFVSDFAVIASYLEKEGYTRVGLFGSSFGGAITVCGAGRVKNLKSIVLWAPVASGKLWYQEWIARQSANPSQEALLVYHDVEINPAFRNQFALLAADSELEKWGEIPLLHLHGEIDETVSLEHQKSFQNYRKGAKAKTRFITYPETKHAFGFAKNFEQVREEIVNWFKETL